MVSLGDATANVYDDFDRLTSSPPPVFKIVAASKPLL
jgi:hypothetical protein